MRATSRTLAGLLLLLGMAVCTKQTDAQAVPRDTWQRVQHAMVKVYGAGGVQGLEAYQSGCFCSKEGHILTADSLVLEQGEVTVLTSSGKRYSGQVLGADPMLRLAVVKVDLSGEVGYVDLSRGAEPRVGQPLLVFANMFNIATGEEPVSVMRTTLTCATSRETAFGSQAPRGTDAVYLTDSVTSNPGAAGGVIVDYRGAAVGVIGVEKRGKVTGGWLNYAIPASQANAAVSKIMQGQSLLQEDQRESLREINTLKVWGFAMVESIAARTPPYVEYVRPGSPAAKAGLKEDDLLVMVNGLVTATVTEAGRLLSLKAGPTRCDVTLQRNGKLIDAQLPPLTSEGQP